MRSFSDRVSGWILIVVLLLLVLGISTAVAVKLRVIALSPARSQSARTLGHAACVKGFSLWPDSWLAIKSRNLLAVQTALSLHNPHPCSWLEGLTNADKLFIAPPVKGWILVTGTGLPEPSDDVDACFRFVLDLSRKLGEVQFFSACRASHYHAWVKAADGEIVRAYAWAGATLWQQGSPTPEEAALGLKCFDYAEAPPGAPLPDPEVLETNSEKVLRLAARWGMDPTRIQEHFPLKEHGVAGKPAYRY